MLDAAGERIDEDVARLADRVAGVIIGWSDAEEWDRERIVENLMDDDSTDEAARAWTEQAGMVALCSLVEMTNADAGIFASD